MISVQRQAFAKQLFLGEIEFQSQLAEHAANRLKNSSMTFDDLEVWSAVQSVLTAAANISRILWPSNERHAERGEMLRALLEINDQHPLSDRDLRNHFEHYDERIEEWLHSNHSAVYNDRMIGPEFGSPLAFPKNFQRSYDPLTQTVAFRGKPLDLKGVLEGIYRIRNRCLSITQI